MRIMVQVSLGKDEAFPHNLDDAAGLVLGALGADPEKDYCTVGLIASPEPGTAGTAPPPPEPFFVQQIEPPPE